MIECLKCQNESSKSEARHSSERLRRIKADDDQHVHDG
jgi:hypothetical protein